ncbi:UbiA prenyltransferase family protein [Raineya orbicola]|jgi:4-hydroxybenzoate polyprenyltransferase|uniref:4-hydroxybenzoate polyprenyltransferase and related prenyltransferase n=1 Tax=Raineya orbicola TaxID=2016530 RepID=A0A2N3I7P2_9BACT|nr:UbiA prenyltransferase family protein [Raineya orbicola]PKQ66318.1 4-hydroxybenzoate polyprenyltransferase and related prenyltransferase [Raineya orbicola]
MKTYFKLLRVHQWVKNTFIFLPAFFGFKLIEIDVWAKLLPTFLSFCFTASCIYIINDYFDIEADKKHPVKRLRPLASGKVKLSSAFIIAFFLISSGMLISYFIDSQLLLILLLYFFMNIAYSKFLKKIALIDIVIIALGFFLRIKAGGVVAGVELSKWIIVMTFLLALFLAFAKRREDVLLMTRENLNVRAAIKGYNLEFINAGMVVTASVILVAYLMYSLSNELVDRTSNNYYFSTFWVVLGILRYFQISFVEEKSSEPSKILFKDKFILFVVVAWLITNFILIYG